MSDSQANHPCPWNVTVCLHCKWSFKALHLTSVFNNVFVDFSVKIPVTSKYTQLFFYIEKKNKKIQTLTSKDVKMYAWGEERVEVLGFPISKCVAYY